MQKLPSLKPGDTVDIIAPASRCTDIQLGELKKLLKSWQLNYLVPDDIFGLEPFCANTDEIRLKHLVNALQNTESKAIICARGGYGSMRLIPELAKIKAPKTTKLFVGMSDITALHLFLQQQWQWPTVHGAAAPDRFSPESISSLKSIAFGANRNVKFTNLTPLNKYAMLSNTIEGLLTGGNLSMVQAGIGTVWQLDAKGKIILLEDTHERGYRVDRILQHLVQANIFKDAVAIVFGDFIEGNETDGSCLIDVALSRFAEKINIPVVRVQGIGHGYTNLPLPLGTMAKLQLDGETTLTCST